MVKKPHLFVRLEKLAKHYPRFTSASEPMSEREARVYQLIVKHHTHEQVQMGLAPDMAEKLVMEKFALYNKKAVVELYTHQPMMLGIPINWLALIAFAGCVAWSVPYDYEKLLVIGACVIAWAVAFVYCLRHQETLIQKRIDNILTQGITENGF